MSVIRSDQGGHRGSGQKELERAKNGVQYTSEENSRKWEKIVKNVQLMMSKNKRGGWGRKINSWWRVGQEVVARRRWSPKRWRFVEGQKWLEDNEKSERRRIEEEKVSVCGNCGLHVPTTTSSLCVLLARLWSLIRPHLGWVKKGEGIDSIVRKIWKCMKKWMKQRRREVMVVVLRWKNRNEKIK